MKLLSRTNQAMGCRYLVNLDAQVLLASPSLPSRFAIRKMLFCFG